ncbi:MFS transporter [Novosphingobium sp. KCTC 2891]|uniref:MFS transporter n=1 Tax=Novosphingobium sp. KCTC 2891 TaxID=2989730 RepID=UPI0022232DA7|nr:MFS transporter [Novosphingobium sp. KCTC 2891]MCW1383812.1 MFS transporter [Novosphingobium sp. KCTC 2891]
MTTATPLFRPSTSSPPCLRDWGMIAGLLLVMTACHGVISAGLPALDKAILADLHIGRGALKLRESIFLMSSGLSGLMIGFICMHVRPSRIVLAGLVLLSGTLTAYAHASSIGEIYALYVLLGLSFASSHVVIVVLMVRARFATLRTLATSIALSGTSIGAAIFPSLIVRALEHTDWRSVVQAVALLPLLLVPVTLWLLRGPAPSGIDEAPRASIETEITTAGTTRLSKPATALLMVATFGTFFASTSFLLNMFLYLQDKGFDAREAASGMSVVFLTGLVGKVAIGAAAERWGSSRVWNTAQLLLLAGALALTFGGTLAMIAGLVLLGAGWAGCYVLTQVVIANSFAGPRLGQMTGAFIVFEAIASGSGVWFAGYTYDLFGSYRPGFIACCALVAISAAATFLFRRTLKRI